MGVLQRPASGGRGRRIGAHFLREAMTVRAELDIASYDRLFPAQDFVPKGSFGNLMALPLQGADPADVAAILHVTC